MLRLCHVAEDNEIFVQDIPGRNDEESLDALVLQEKDVSNCLKVYSTNLYERETKCSAIAFEGPACLKFMTHSSWETDDYSGACISAVMAEKIYPGFARSEIIGRSLAFSDWSGEEENAETILLPITNIFHPYVADGPFSIFSGNGFNTKKNDNYIFAPTELLSEFSNMYGALLTYRRETNQEDVIRVFDSLHYSADRDLHSVISSRYSDSRDALRNLSVFDSFFQIISLAVSIVAMSFVFCLALLRIRYELNILYRHRLLGAKPRYLAFGAIVSWSIPSIAAFFLALILYFPIVSFALCEMNLFDFANIVPGLMAIMTGFSALALICLGTALLPLGIHLVSGSNRS